MPVTADRRSRRTAPPLKLVDQPSVPFAAKEPHASVPILIMGERYRLVGPTLKPPPPGAFLAPAASMPGGHYLIVPLPPLVEPTPERPWPRLATLSI